MQREEMMRKKERSEQIKTNREIRLEEAKIRKESWKKRREPKPETEDDEAGGENRWVDTEDEREEEEIMEDQAKIKVSHKTL